MHPLVGKEQWKNLEKMIGVKINASYTNALNTFERSFPWIHIVMIN